MRRVLSELDPSLMQADFCIIGSGPAGSTLALELEKAGRSVLLLEAGGEDWTEDSQQVYAGENVGDPYLPLDTARLRFLGGTSNHWAGWCRTLDAIDFEAKNGFPTAQWPISKADLEPFHDRAAAILEVGEQPEDVLLDPETGISEFFFTYSPPVVFGTKYIDHFTASQAITLVLNANVTLIKTDGSRVTGLTIEDFEGNTREVTCNTCILATGGIENSRMLLWSDAQQNGALVPADAPVGRYWMEHPHFTIGQAIVPTHYAEAMYFTLSPEKQRELGILNCGLRFLPSPYKGTKKKIADLACVAPAVAERLAVLARQNLVCGAQLRAAWEQVPNPDSRVSLSRTETDRFGIPRGELNWQKQAADLETARQTAMAFGEHLARNDYGRVRLADWVLDGGDFPADDELGGYHHMGGTRMATSATEGVVDTNCKVFGKENFYIAGSSVFPAGGHANPTMTIVQMTLRLADHLASLG